MPYTAGTIFLQVVPSYQNVQRSIAAEAKKWAAAAGEEFDKEFGKGAKKAVDNANDELEKGTSKGASKAGTKAGDEYAGRFISTIKSRLARATRELGSIPVDVDVRQAGKNIEDLTGKLEALGDKDFDISANPGRAIAEIQVVEKALDKLRLDAEKDINIRVDAGAAMAELAAVRAMVERVQKDLDPGTFATKFRKAVDSAFKDLGEMGGADKKIERKIADIRAELESLRNITVGVDMDSTEASRRLEELRAQLVEISHESADVDVRVNTLAASAELKEFSRLAREIDGKNVDVHVEAHGTGAAIAGLAGVEVAARRAGGSADNTANSFRAFNGVIFALAAVGPAIVPALGAIAGGIAALGVAAIGAASGLGVAILAFSGLSAVVKGITDVQKNAAKDAVAQAKAIRTANKGVADAESGLARARESAARSTEDSARRVADARRASADAIDRANEQQIQAERRLADAQRDAKRAQDDLRQARLDAARDLEDLAQRNKEDPLRVRESELSLRRAQQRLAGLPASASPLDREQASIDVAQAKLDLEEIRRETKRNADDYAKARKAGVEGSDRVRSAQDRLTQAIRDEGDARRGVQEAAKDADRARVEGAQRVSDAIRDQKQAQKDAARTIEDAQRRLANAEKNRQDALDKTSASQKKLNDALANVGPAGAKFAYFLAGVLEGLKRIRNIAQAGMLPGVQEAMEGLAKTYGPAFTKFIGRMSKALGDFSVHASEVFQGPVWQEFFATIDRFSITFTRQFGDIALNIATGLAGIGTAFAPTAKDFGDALVSLTGGFAEWGAHLKDSDSFKQFIEWLHRIGPKVGDFIKQLGGAFVNLGQALAPFGELVLDKLTDFLRFIANMDPDKLAHIATVIISIALAFQLLAGAMAVRGTLKNLAETLGSKGALASLAIGLAAITFIDLYANNKKFRDIVDEVVGKLWAMHDVILAIGGIITLTYLPALGQAVIGTATSMGAIIASWALGRAAVIRSALVMAAGWLAAMGPIGWIILATLVIAGGAYMIVKNWTGIKEQTLDFWNSLCDSLQGIWIVKMSMWFTDQWGKWRKNWNNYWHGVNADGSTDWGSITGMIQGSWNAVSSWFTERWAESRANWHNYWQGVHDDGSTDWGSIVGMIKGSWNAVSDWFTGTVWPTSRANWHNYWQGVHDDGSTDWGSIVGMIKGAWNSLSGWFSGTSWPTSRSNWHTYWQGIHDDGSTDWGSIVGMVKGAWNGLADWFNRSAWPTFKSNWNTYWDGINADGSTDWGSITGVVRGAWNGLSTWFNGTAWPDWSAGWNTFWENNKQGADTRWSKMTTSLENAWTGLSNWFNREMPKFTSWLHQTFSNMNRDTVSIFGNMVDGISRVWSKIGSKIQGPVNWVITHVLNNGIIDGINKVLGWLHVAKIGHLGTINAKPPTPTKTNNVGSSNIFGQVKRPPQLASGGIAPDPYGVRPGYTPGRDTHLIAVGGGEAVMRPEWTRAVGKRTIDRWNRAARMGRYGYALGGVIPGFASGGLASFHGHKETPAFAARLRAAESLAGVTFNIFQGGWHPGVSASAGTHDKDAIDVGPITNGVVTAMRKAGIAAWIRTRAQGFSPHIHGVPLPGGGVQLSPSAYQQTQDYLAGKNGLAGGGKDDGPRVGVLTSLLAKLGQTLSNAGSFFTTIWDKVKTLGDWGKRAVKDRLSAAADFIGGAKGLLNKFVFKPATALAGKVTGHGAPAGSGINKMVTAIPRRVIENITNGIPKIIDMVKKANPGAADLLTSSFAGIVGTSGPKPGKVWNGGAVFTPDGPRHGPYSFTPPGPGQVIRTMATWFGKGPDDGGPMAGGGNARDTANGVAIWKLPFGTPVHIASERTGKGTVAPVKDRGPAAWTHHGLDMLWGTWDALGLSRGAGKQIVQFWYDQGGFLPPGGTMAYNDTGKPEAVLTDRQWQLIRQTVTPALVGHEFSDRAGSGGDFNVTIPISNYHNPDEVADAFHFKYRQLRRGGVYARGTG